MLIYDLNAFLEADTTLQGLIRDGFRIRPMLGGDAKADQSIAPFLLYWNYKHIKDKERYYWYRDIIKYEIWDTNVERMDAIAEEFIDILNKGDNIQLVDITTNHLIKCCFLSRGAKEAPTIRNGWYCYTLIFDIEYL